MLKAKKGENQAETGISSRVVDGRRVLDLGNHTPALLAILNNKLSRGASKLYLRTFGVGITEWRSLAVLAIEPDIPAARVAEVTGMDRAAVSRALAKLQADRLVLHEASSSDTRRKSWRLSRAGTELHARILTVALRRENALLDGLSDDEVRTFNRLTRRLIENLMAVEEISPADDD